MSLSTLRTQQNAQKVLIVGRKLAIARNGKFIQINQTAKIQRHPNNGWVITKSPLILNFNSNTPT